jgi:hypothetical protein
MSQQTDELAEKGAEKLLQQKPQSEHGEEDTKKNEKK